MTAPPDGDEWIATLTELEAQKDAAYLERNKLVALLASIFPSGNKQTAIEGWSEDWHGCVYIDFPWGQASWHYHDSQAALFKHLPPYAGEWDGHTTDQKYDAIQKASRDGPSMQAAIAAAEAEVARLLSRVADLEGQVARVNNNGNKITAENDRLRAALEQIAEGRVYGDGFAFVWHSRYQALRDHARAALEAGQ